MNRKEIGKFLVIGGRHLNRWGEAPVQPSTTGITLASLVVTNTALGFLAMHEGNAAMAAGMAFNEVQNFRASAKAFGIEENLRKLAVLAFGTNGSVLAHTVVRPFFGRRIFPFTEPIPRSTTARDVGGWMMNIGRSLRRQNTQKSISAA